MSSLLIILPSGQFTSPDLNTHESQVLNAIAERAKLSNTEVRFLLSQEDQKARLKALEDSLTTATTPVTALAISSSGDFLLEFLKKHGSTTPVDAYLVGTFPSDTYDFQDSNNHVHFIFGENDQVTFVEEGFDIAQLQLIEKISAIQIIEPTEYAKECGQQVSLSTGSAPFSIIPACDHFLFPENAENLSATVELVWQLIQKSKQIQSGISRFGKSSQNFRTSPVHSKPVMSPRLRSLLQPSSKILDAGCGAGHWGSSLGREQDTVVFLDPSSAMLDQANLTTNHGPSSYKFVNGNTEAIPFSDQEFDLVTSRLAMHHFRNWKAGLAEMIRVTKRGGLIAIVDLAPPEDESLYQLHHELEVLHDPSHIETVRSQNLTNELQGLGANILQQVNGYHEMAEGITVSDWCSFVNTEPKGQKEIVNLLKNLKVNELNDLGFKQDGADFRYLVKSQFIVAQVP